MRRVRFWLLVGSLLGTAACSDDEDGGRSGPPYAGVDWRCYEGPDDCWCANEASSTNPRVEVCSYTNCYTYQYYGWHCECRPEPYAPEEDWQNAESVEACPPE